MDIRRFFARAAALVTAAVLAASLSGCGAGGGAEPDDGGAVGGRGGPTASPTGPDTDGEQYTPVVMDVQSTPRWFTGTDRRAHLVYELRLFNAFPVDATPEKVEILDAGTGEVVDTIEGDALAAAFSLQPLGLPAVEALAPSTTGIVWLDIAFDDAAAIPAEIAHRLTVRMAPGLPVPEEIVSTGASAAVDTDDPTVIGPPLSGPGWVAVGSCCDGPHRRAMQPIDNGIWVAQRFAIDFNRVDADNYFVTGDPARNESWLTYDQPVLAVADATVVAAANDQPDQTPGDPTPVTIEQADGNYVILELDDGVYAFYAHLKPGSVAVAVGDTVTVGDEIARTGNSGSSTGPHLHFQMMNRPSALLADGLPYVFDRFTLAGEAPPIADIMSADPATTAIRIDTSDAGPRTDELPLGRDVVTFPELVD